MYFLDNIFIYFLYYFIYSCEINESPVILKLNPFTRNSDLPVTMYESVIDLVNGEAKMLFVELSYTLATEEAERIGVDHVARMASGDSSESSQGIEVYLHMHHHNQFI